MHEEEHAGTRLKRAMVAKGVTNTALAEAAGVSVQAVGKWIKTGKIARERLPSICEKLGVTAGELIGGNEVRETRSPYLRAITVWNDAKDLAPEQYVMLPRLEIRLSAGGGGPVIEAAEPNVAGAAFRADYAALKHWSPATHYTMRAKGDSMEPTIQDGAPVVIAINETVIRSGRVYAFLLGDETLLEPFLKRLDKLPGGRVRVRSDNTSNRAYDPYEIAESDLQVIGRAVWTPIEL